MTPLPISTITKVFHPRIVPIPNATIIELFYYGLLLPNVAHSSCQEYLDNGPQQNGTFKIQSSKTVSAFDVECVFIDDLGTGSFFSRVDEQRAVYGPMTAPCTVSGSLDNHGYVFDIPFIQSNLCKLSRLFLMNILKSSVTLPCHMIRQVVMSQVASRTTSPILLALNKSL